jgi:hypothetical protein
MFIQNLKFSNQIKNLKNTEHMTNNKDSDDHIINLIKKEINYDMEAIRNLGSISKSLLTGKNYHNTSGVTPGDLTIPSNVIIQGNSLAVSVGTIILWGLTTPPPPNNQNNKVPFGPGNNGDSWTLGSDDYWAPCTGKSYNSIQTPDLRNRLPLGHGSWGGDLNTNGGGNVPIRNHKHPINHKHNITIQHWPTSQAGLYTGSDGVTGAIKGDQHTSITSEPVNDHIGMSGHADDVASSVPRPSPYRMSNYNKDTTPYYSIVQYWMRVR